MKAGGFLHLGGGYGKAGCVGGKLGPCQVMLGLIISQ